MDKLDYLVKELGFNRIKMDEPLSNYTYIKVGGPADFLYESHNKDDLILSVNTARKLSLPLTILGIGANVLVSDKGIRGLVVINRSENIRFLANDFVEVDSGVNVVRLIKDTTERSLTGLERMIKVPATVGGAIFMNAGHTARQEFFGDLVVSVEILTPDNQVKKLMKKECGFGYRTSRFQTSGEVILSAMLHLEKVDKSVIEEKVRDLLVIKQIQPAGPSMGSTFRNPEGGSAGRMLDESGMKGKQVGGAKVSEKHANFILNVADAKAEDVHNLMNLMKKSVAKKFNVELEPEVRLIGDWQ